MERQPQHTPFNCPDPAVFERLADVEKSAAVSWQVVVDFQKEMRDGFKAVIERQDKTNSRLTHLERFSWMAAGGVGMLSFIVATFAVALVVTM